MVPRYLPSRRVGERGRDLPSPRDHLSTTSSQHFRESRQQLHVTAFNFIDDDDDSTHHPPPEQQQTTTMPQAQPELKKVREPFLLLRSAITTSLLFQKARSNGRQDASDSRKEANFSQSHITVPRQARRSATQRLEEGDGYPSWL